MAMDREANQELRKHVASRGVSVLSCYNARTISYCNAEAHIPSQVSPNDQRNETLASSSTLLDGQCCSCSWHRISWLVGNSEHFYPMGNGVQHTNTTPHHTPRPLAFYPGGQALTTLTKPPPFFTPRAVPQCTTVQAQWQAEAGLCSCCPCPVSPCHWPASQQIWFSGTGTDTVTKPHSEPCINKSKRVLLACMLLLRIWFRVGTVNAWPRVTQHRLVLWHLLSTFFLFCFWEASNIGGHRSPKE